MALNRAFCDALKPAFASVGLAAVPYRCSAYRAWRLGERVVKEEVRQTKSGQELVVTARFTINAAYLKDTITEKTLQPGTRVALLVTERVPGGNRFMIGSEGEALMEARLREELEARGLKVDRPLQLADATRAALASGAAVDPRGPACLARNGGAQLLIWVRNDRKDGGEIGVPGLRSYQDAVTLTAIPTESLTALAPAPIHIAVPCIAPTLAPVSCAKLYRDGMIGPVVTHALARLAEDKLPR